MLLSTVDMEPTGTRAPAYRLFISIDYIHIWNWQYKILYGASTLKRWNLTNEVIFYIMTIEYDIPLTTMRPHVASRHQAITWTNAYFLSMIFYGIPSNFIESAQAIILYYEFGNYTFKITDTPPRGNELKKMTTVMAEKYLNFLVQYMSLEGVSLHLLSSPVLFCFSFLWGYKFIDAVFIVTHLQYDLC